MAVKSLKNCCSEQQGCSCSASETHVAALDFQSWHLPSLPAFPHGSPIASISQLALPEVVSKAAQFAASWVPALGLGSAATAPASAASAASTTTSQAEKLKSALSAYNAFGQGWKAQLLGAVLASGGLLGATGNLLSPTGPGGCDHNAFERCANCATSAPYVLVGVHAIKNRKTQAGKAWGASMCAVGMASTAFHASSGSLRPACRRMDYWSIALASNLLTRAVFPDLPAAVTAVGMVLTPFKPFVVSFLNSTAMELKYLQRAQQRPELRRAQRIHAATCLAGLGVFALEDLVPKMPLVHATWHCLSAAAVATVNHLLEDCEREQAAAGTSGRRHRHTAGKRQQLLLTDGCSPLVA